ncbi:hypothetical protein DFS34DRAFT_65526 [Phlyctochytrium arcticum]|nr:hypothetical protein DFS34DRAFT_65526 [Phlyctochytrium arcticum]
MKNSGLPPSHRKSGFFPLYVPCLYSRCCQWMPFAISNSPHNSRTHRPSLLHPQIWMIVSHASFIRSMEASQLPQIRQLSLEILARFPPEKIVSHLEPLIASAWQERNFAQVRGWMYWLCHALGIWVRQVEGLILQRGVSVAVDIFSGFENDVSESGMQVTRSAIDFIAVIVSLLVTEEIKSGRVPATNLGPAITDISNVKTLENVLSFMCTKLSPQDASQQQLRTSLSNSTVKAFQNLTGQQAESRLLCQLVFDSVLAAAQNEAADTIAFAAHCQVLFHVVYTLTAALKGDRSFSISGGTIQICLKGIQSELEIAQTASVKLLAACLSALPENVPERPSLLHALEKVVTKSRSTNPEGSALAKRVMLGLMARQRA